jgi:hypothetical protein
MAQSKKGQDALLAWCQRSTAGYDAVSAINDFDDSWTNGLAFCALLHYFRPKECGFDFQELSQRPGLTNQDRLNIAFDSAQKLGIAKLIEVEDMLPPNKPNKEAVITYLSQYYRILQDQAARRAPNPQSHRQSIRFLIGEGSKLKSGDGKVAANVFVGAGDESTRPLCVKW